MNRFPCTLCGSRNWPRENAGCPLCEIPDEDEKSCPEGLYEPTCCASFLCDETPNNRPQDGRVCDCEDAPCCGHYELCFN
jgi:hypothetical protein